MTGATDAPCVPQEAQQQQTAPPLRTAGTEEWQAWLRAQLVAHQYAMPAPGHKIRYYLTALERDIAAALPGSGAVSIETLRNVVYRGALPTHHTARGLAAAFGLSEIAVLLRSGQLDWDAITPLLDLRQAVLRSEREYQEARAHIERDIRDPHWRSRMLALLEHEWALSYHLASQLRWLGVSADEWERMRAELNSPEGRRRLRHALSAPDAAAEDDTENSAPPLSQEYLDAANRPDIDRLP